MDLAHYARELVQRFVADLYEGRYSLAVPIQRGKSCVEYCLKVLELSREQARLHLRKAVDEGVVVLKHKLHILNVLVVFVFLKRHVQRSLRHLIRKQGGFSGDLSHHVGGVDLSAQLLHESYIRFDVRVLLTDIRLYCNIFPSTRLAVA